MTEHVPQAGFAAPTTATILVARLATFLHAAWFVLGFSVVFVVGWGGAATLIGQAFAQFKPALAQFGGVIVIVFGLHTLGVVRLRWLDYDTRPQRFGRAKAGYLSSGLLGMVFAAGWTPCICVTLGAILTLGLSQQSAPQAMVLASGYALGLGLPFLALGLVATRSVLVVRSIAPYTRTIQLASGVLLLAGGLLLLTGRMPAIAAWAQRSGFFLDLPLGGAVEPTYGLAILAGLVSFLSPCVLPLVPAYLGHLGGWAARRAALEGGPRGDD